MKSGGKEPADYDMVISRICEEFHCLPWQAEEQMERDSQQVIRILDLRSYRDTYFAIANAKKPEDVPKGTLTDWYADFELADLEQRMAEMNG